MAIYISKMKNSLDPFLLIEFCPFVLDQNVKQKNWTEKR